MQNTYQQFPGEITLDNLDDLFSFHKSRFAGFTMEEGDPDPEPEPDPEVTPDPDPEVDPDPEPDPEEDPEGELDLDAAKAALSKVRKSEAKMRTRLRDIEAKLEGAKTPEEIEAIVKGVQTDAANEARELLVENVALKHKLPEDLAAALKGDTREELEAHAAVLAKYAPVEPSDDPELEGGLKPGGDAAPTAAQLAAEMRKSRRNRG